LAISFGEKRTKLYQLAVLLGNCTYYPKLRLLNKTAFLELKPWYFQSWQQAEKHGAEVWHYLWSFDENIPSIKSSSDQGLGAKTGDTRVKALMNGSKGLTHDLGAYTKSPADDRLKYSNRL